MEQPFARLDFAFTALVSPVRMSYLEIVLFFASDSEILVTNKEMESGKCKTNQNQNSASAPSHSPFLLAYTSYCGCY
ncbi:hypothetical protein ACLOJK_037231 [Asimina triloba]